MREKSQLARTSRLEVGKTYRSSGFQNQGQ
jgi:hypothetical protein